MWTRITFYYIDSAVPNIVPHNLCVTKILDQDNGDDDRFASLLESV